MGWLFYVRMYLGTLKNLENIKKMIDVYNKKLNLKDSLKKSSFILMVFFIKIVSF